MCEPHDPHWAIVVEEASEDGQLDVGGDTFLIRAGECDALSAIDTPSGDATLTAALPAGELTEKWIKDTRRSIIEVYLHGYLRTAATACSPAGYMLLVEDIERITFNNCLDSYFVALRLSDPDGNRSETACLRVQFPEDRSSFIISAEGHLQNGCSTATLSPSEFAELHGIQLAIISLSLMDQLSLNRSSTNLAIRLGIALSKLSI